MVNAFERYHRNGLAVKKSRSPIDRRSGVDRRRAHNLDYFLRGGLERRSWEERRSQSERRSDWIRVTDWVSVSEGDLYMWYRAL